TGAENGEPVVGATVEAGSVSTTTDADGTYRLWLEPGVYDVEFSEFSYETKTVPDVTVEDGEFTDVSVEIDQLPVGSIAGEVTLDLSGQGVPNARVSVTGAPRSATTDAQRQYELVDLPEGEYEVAISHGQFGTPEAQAVTV